MLSQPQFGKSPEGDRLERIKKSPHYKNGVFENLSPTTLMSEEASYFKLFKLQFSKVENKEPSNPLPTIKRNLKQSAEGKPLITWFGHSSFLLQIEGKNILVDPVFSERPSPVSFIGPQSFKGTMVYSLSDLPKIDYIFITHDHYDHLDYPTIVKFKNSNTKFITALGVGSHLEYWGIPADHISELDWWDKKDLMQGFQVIATPARHFSGRAIKDRNKTLWASFVLQCPEHTIFIGGDSGYDFHFKEIGDQFGPFDIAILEAGQYYKYWPAIHMMPEETVRANEDLRAKVLLPVHWGKFSLSFHTWTEPIERVTGEAKRRGVKVTTPKIGELIDLDLSLPHSKWWLSNKLQD